MLIDGFSISSVESSGTNTVRLDTLKQKILKSLVREIYYKSLFWGNWKVHFPVRNIRIKLYVFFGVEKWQ
jgi:hypothetical protein